MGPAPDVFRVSYRSAPPADDPPWQFVSRVRKVFGSHYGLSRSVCAAREGDHGLPSDDDIRSAEEAVQRLRDWAAQARAEGNHAQANRLEARADSLHRTHGSGHQDAEYDNQANRPSGGSPGCRFVSMLVALAAAPVAARLVVGAARMSKILWRSRLLTMWYGLPMEWSTVVAFQRARREGEQTARQIRDVAEAATTEMLKIVDADEPCDRHELREQASPLRPPLAGEGV